MDQNDSPVRRYVDVSNLSVSYEQACILESIEFNSQQGEFVAIVGTSGSGKTTFLNALASFVQYQGVVTRPNNIGYMFQNHSLFPWLTVFENVAFPLKGIAKKKQVMIVEGLLEKIGMKGYGKRYGWQLSGGQIQRIAFARTLAAEPELILMDEPFSSLDHYTRERMQEWLLDVLLQARNDGKAKSVILVTHFLDEAIFLADRIVVLKDKKFSYEFTVPFPRPREENIRYTNEFQQLKKEINSKIN